MDKIQLVQLNQDELLESISGIIKKRIDESLRKLKIDDNKDNEKGFEFLTRKETSEMLQVSYNCLHDWVRNGTLQSYKIGNRTYFKYDEIVKALNSSRKKMA